MKLVDFPFEAERRSRIEQCKFRNLTIEISEAQVALFNTRGAYAQFVIRSIENAIQTEVTRPFREVLGMNGKSKE